MLNKIPLTQVLPVNSIAVLVDLLAVHPANSSIQDCAFRLRLGRNTVSEQMNNLYKMGLVERVNRYSWRISQTGFDIFRNLVDNSPNSVDNLVDNSVDNISALFAKRRDALSECIGTHSESASPYDHDDNDHMVIDNDLLPSLINSLKNYGFVDAEKFVTQYPNVSAWVDWANSLPESAVENFRGGIKGVGGMIRNGCRDNRLPPSPVVTAVPVCDSCGKSDAIFDGICLRCNGNVQS
ncbi:MAG: hypothetical protein CUN56_00060 [Phototrophicales bacterium]|nr:MAG: hypothetical protein CUN56_00060 [Phototrophicales bacterium]